MQYVICYDIGDDRRRERMADTLKDFGRRVQFSVFVADLEADLADELYERIRKAVRPEDRVHVFALCESCARRTATLGRAEVPLDEEFYIV